MEMTTKKSIEIKLNNNRNGIMLGDPRIHELPDELTKQFPQ